MSRNKSSCTELEILDNETDKVDSFFHHLFVIQSVDQVQRCLCFSLTNHKNCNWYCQRDQASPIIQSLLPPRVAQSIRWTFWLPALTGH